MSIGIQDRHVHGRPHHILDQNSTVFQDVMNLMNIAVPVHQVHECAVDGLGVQQIIFVRELCVLIPEMPIHRVAELEFEQASQIRLKLFELYVHSSDGLARRPWWKCHYC